MGSLRLNITMRGLTGLIISLAFYSYQCAKFQEGNCSYGCNPDGSCNVASGGNSASCSSPQSQFGGECIGANVNGCRDCREACGNGSNGGSSSTGGIRDIPDSTCRRKYGCCNCKEICDSFGECRIGSCVSCDPPTAAPPRASGGSSSGNGSGGSKSDRNCKYECQSNGGCKVTYIGPSRPGQLSGSCFPSPLEDPVLAPRGSVRTATRPSTAEVIIEWC